MISGVNVDTSQMEVSVPHLFVPVEHNLLLLLMLDHS